MREFTIWDKLGQLERLEQNIRNYENPATRTERAEELAENFLAAALANPDEEMITASADEIAKIAFACADAFMAEANHRATFELKRLKTQAAAEGKKDA